MQYDANGSRFQRLLTVTKCSTPVTKTDSTVLAVADSALLQAINADKEVRTNPDGIAVAE